MTDYDNMQAGREMDAEVHRALWPRHNIQTFENLDLLLWHFCDGSHEKSSTCRWQMVPHYSTDIAAAWLMVEKMLAEDIELHLAHDGTEWRVGTLYWNGEWNEFSDAHAAPLAICRAALKAVHQETSLGKLAEWDTSAGEVGNPVIFNPDILKREDKR